MGKKYFCNMIKRIGFLLVIITLLVSFSSKPERKTIELVLVVDLSASTNGLLQSLEKKYWDIIYDFNRYYPDPNLKIGLIGMGRNQFKEKNNYVAVLCDLTYDYDKIPLVLSELPDVVSEGDAQPGAAVNKALGKKLSWSEDPSVFKSICLIGNGSINAGNVNPKEVIPHLEKRGIRLNTFYFKNPGTVAESKGWSKYADKCNGVFDEFVLEEPSVDFHKKYDPNWIDEIGQDLSKTYIYYGEGGKEKYEDMMFLDSLSRTMGEDAWESRAIFKSSRFYQRKNASWDLVDLFTTGEINFSKIDRELLPEFLRSLSDQKLKEYVQIKKIERKELIAELAVQASKRDLHLYRKRMKLSVFRFDKEFSTALVLGLNKSFSGTFKVTY